MFRGGEFIETENWISGYQGLGDMKMRNDASV